MLGNIWRLLGQTRVPTDRAARGVFGEREAAKLLKKKGCRILQRNWRNGKDELDLIVQDGAMLVFVEVRSRAAEAVVNGYQSVSAKKKTCLLRACRAYLRQLRPRPPYFRFDIVEVRLGMGEDFSIHHYENVPLFPDSFT
ncbi:YraN family protein [Cerasicoccus arenae]|uniref:YraN family protein n=1 Tax=Cerasicoccus arenae TaxID=424488 RepID=UPI001674F041|nr:YraN family protein [Cerasicoccus arenae]MBK1857604.1 YraN family protein [Cerasicoccus arenae]